MTNRRVALLFVVAGASLFMVSRLVGGRGSRAPSETQRVLMENQFWRVSDVRGPAGVAEPLHSHGRGVTVALTDYDNETRAPGAQWAKSHTRVGEVKWA